MMEMKQKKRHQRSRGVRSNSSAREPCQSDQQTNIQIIKDSLFDFQPEGLRWSETEEGQMMKYSPLFAL
jgi:hypothetical protein